MFSKLHSLFLVFAFLCLIGCSDGEDEPKPNPPTGSVTASASGSPGGLVRLKGSFMDEDGLDTVILSNNDLGIDATTTLNGVKTFSMDEQFNIAANVVTGDYAVKVVVTNVIGGEAEFTIMVTIST